MRFDLLGPMEIRWAGGDVSAVSGPRVRGLLALLLLDAGRVVHADRLIDGLYGGRPPSLPTRALQSQVSRLRQALRGGAEVTFHQSGYRLAVEPEAVDVHRFQRLAADGRAALNAGRAARAADLLGEALALWRGAALSGATMTPGLAARAERLEELRRDALEDRAEADLAEGRCHRPVADLREHVGAHPLRERPRGQLMRALHGCGRTAEALALYEETRRVLADELGTEPGAELRAVHLAVLRDEPVVGPGSGTSRGVRVRTGDSGEDRAPSPRPPVHRSSAPAPPPPPPASGAGSGPGAGRHSTADGAAARPVTTGAALRSAAGSAPEGEGPGPGPARHPGAGAAAASGRRRLPAALTGFVGRDEPVRRLDLLLDRARLVTLTGVGGVGKTRLAVEVAARRAEEVCLVELAGDTPTTDVPRAVLAALGLGDTPASALPGAGASRTTELLLSALADRSSLLVLDTCEHVVDDVSRLARELLSGCPGLTVLATSREPLGITGETLFPVTPLEVPARDAALTAEEALRLASVRLFTDRARAVRADFVLDGDTLAPVLGICRALDGLPLALELAAARLRSLPVAALAAGLEDPFALLSRGSRTAVPRHRSLGAALDWSWDLLDEEERALARRLSVFPSGATPTAVERVCGPFTTGTLDLLSSLADKSLVTVADADGPRFGMLETVRAYCARRLTEAGEAERTRRAHALHGSGPAEAAVTRTRDGAGYAATVVELPRTPLHRSAYQEPMAALRLAAVLWRHWWRTGTAGGDAREPEVRRHGRTLAPPGPALHGTTRAAGPVRVPAPARSGPPGTATSDAIPATVALAAGGRAADTGRAPGTDHPAAVTSGALGVGLPAAAALGARGVNLPAVPAGTPGPGLSAGAVGTPGANAPAVAAGTPGANLPLGADRAPRTHQQPVGAEPPAQSPHPAGAARPSRTRPSPRNRPPPP
ncbi:BTAD domain-containing putative transcriptional regulator [Streptomyces griseoflavus]|uniref:AfsR/SARP family transcriptional regulator n=1 Tax=Streptomyces griseoflavus TaxID=35619 RepID=UPI0033B64A6D